VATVASPSHALVGRTGQAIEIAERSLEHRRSLGDSLHAVDAHVHLVALVVAYQEAGQLTEAEALAQWGHDDAVAARSFDGRGFSALGLGRVALAQGRPETATRYFSEAVLVYRDLSARACLRWALGGLAFARAMAGDADGAVAAVADLDRAPATSVRMLESDLLRARAWTAHIERRPGRAKSLLLDAAVEARDSGQHSLESAALHDLVRMGARGQAVARLEELAQVVDGAFAAARAEHARALETSDAAGLDRVAETFDEIGALLTAAEAASEAARLHQEAGRHRPATRSAMRARQLHDQCEGARPGSLPWAATIEPLTRRAREIALLAAEGFTSPAIGDRLSLSVRTVDNHLRHAYTKLGINGRHELAPAIAHW
jgi:DNA-binding CsgD family transcriptional regulator